MDGGDEQFDGFNDEQRRRAWAKWHRDRDGLWSDKVAMCMLLALFLWVIIA